MKPAAYLILIVILGTLLFSGKLVYSRFQLSANINDFIHTAFGGGDDAMQLAKLKQENEALRAQVFNQNTVDDKIKVYSVHPFNNPGEIVINVGLDRGVKIGDIITTNKILLVGKVKQVFNSYSVVTTIFNSDTKIAVRVGPKEEDALFNGGSNVSLTLLSPKAGIVEGDIVVTAQKDYSYGLEVGRIKTVTDALGDPIGRAIIEPGFDLRDLRNVEIYD